MVAARPTRDRDLRNVRHHSWCTNGGDIPYCVECELVMPVMLWGIPPCPGPGYYLRQRGRHEA